MKCYYIVKVRITLVFSYFYFNKELLFFFKKKKKVTKV